jgi:REP-associated tyrosine transposase
MHLGRDTAITDSRRTRNRLVRVYGRGHLHFITCSCYKRLPLLGTAKARYAFLAALAVVRDQYDFALIGYVAMPEHIHPLLSEPNRGNPSEVMKSLKQRVSRTLRMKRKNVPSQLRLWDEDQGPKHFWQRRFYDFNVWSRKKTHGKLNYIHFNPVKRGLVARPADWRWSSYSFYARGEKGVCVPNPNWIPDRASRTKTTLFPRTARKEKVKTRTLRKDREECGTPRS